MDDRRCLVVDKQAVVRAGVRRLLDDEYDVEEASSLREAMDAMTATGGFDVAVVELDPKRHTDGGPAGVAVIRAIRKAMPQTGVVALAQRPERHSVKHALDSGATAFVAKSSPTETIRKAIDCAADFTEFVDPAARHHDAPLTRRQGQILQLLADGLSTTDVADRLGVSAETVRTHTKGTLARLEARDRAHAVAIGLRNGLID